MFRDISDHASSCHTCAWFRSSAAGNKPMLDFHIPAERWNTLGIDFIKLPRGHNGWQYLLVAVDIFTMYIALAPLQDKTAELAAHTLVNSVFCTLNVLHRIISNNGTEFINELMTHVKEIYNNERCYTAAFHPQGNALVERTKRKILENFHPLICGIKENWDFWEIPLVEHFKYLTAFRMMIGHYKFNRMPFVLRNAPSTLQRLMYAVFKERLEKVFCLLRRSDTFSKDLKSHLNTLEMVRKTLPEVGLKTELYKCSFWNEIFCFWVMPLIGTGFPCFPTRSRLSRTFLLSLIRTKCAIFLGQLHFKEIFFIILLNAKPPHKAWSPWGRFSLRPWRRAKFLLPEIGPVPYYPYISKPFHLTTDTLFMGLEAVIQQGDSSSRKRVISYASRTVFHQEARYSVSEPSQCYGCSSVQDISCWATRCMHIRIINPCLASSMINICRGNWVVEALPSWDLLPGSITCMGKIIS